MNFSHAIFIYLYIFEYQMKGLRVCIYFIKIGVDNQSNQTLAIQIFTTPFFNNEKPNYRKVTFQVENINKNIKIKMFANGLSYHRDFDICEENRG